MIALLTATILPDCGTYTVALYVATVPISVQETEPPTMPVPDDADVIIVANAFRLGADVVGRTSNPQEHPMSFQFQRTRSGDGNPPREPGQWLFPRPGWCLAADDRRACRLPRCT